ncbi:MAG: ribosome recycling factor, partial [Methanoregula sp.]
GQIANIATPDPQLIVIRAFDPNALKAIEKAILQSEKPPGDRQGNWVQKFSTDADAMLFATAQFSRYQEVEAFIRENFRNPDHISRTIHDKRGRS